MPVLQSSADKEMAVAGLFARFGEVMTLSVPNACNQRAGLRLITFLSVLLGFAAVAQGAGKWFDPNGAAGDLFGQAMTTLSDVNGDGFDEFLIGVAGSDTTGLDAGQVFMWFGGSAVTLAPDRIWNGVSPEQFGWSIANIGDVNGDLKEDWAVGAPLSNAGGGPARGRVCVFFGGANPSTTPDLVIIGENANDQFGFALSAAGDFDGDGIGDFIIGAPYSNRHGIDAGAVYIVYGAAGVGPSIDLAAATVMEGEVAADHFGWSVAAAGNFLGGAEACVAVGAPLANTHGGIDAGAVYVFAGRLGGAVPDTTIDFVAGTSATAKPNSQFGYTVQGDGHLDADGFSDLVVGAPFSNAAAATAGRVEIFFGGQTPAVVAGHAINGESATDNFGWSIDVVGDVAGSTADDVLIGAPFRDALGANAGGAYVYVAETVASSAVDLLSVPLIPIQPGTVPDDHFGNTVAAAGDFDGDGMPDYAVASPGGNIGGTNAIAGFVTLVHSTPGPVAAFMRQWKAAWHGLDQVDLTMAFSVPATQLVDFELRRDIRSGGVLQSGELVWSGSALRQDTGGTGVLGHTATGYVFRDAFLAPLLADDLVSYALIVTATDGTQWRLPDLAGPGLPAVVPHVILDLAPAWPNPANPAVTIRFRVADGLRSSLQIIDLRGQVVRTLDPGLGLGTWQELIWRGDTTAGSPAPSGVYLIRLNVGPALRTERVVLAR